jgi:hypothetical protein
MCSCVQQRQATAAWACEDDDGGCPAHTPSERAEMHKAWPSLRVTRKQRTDNNELAILGPPTGAAFEDGYVGFPKLCSSLPCTRCRRVAGCLAAKGIAD